MLRAHAAMCIKISLLLILSSVQPTLFRKKSFLVMKLFSLLLERNKDIEKRKRKKKMKRKEDERRRDEREEK